MTRAPGKGGLFSRFRTDNAGVALLEFALIAPIMIALYLGCVEFCLAMMANKRATHSGAQVGDLVAQFERLNAAEMNDIFRISRTSMMPYPHNRLRVRVTQMRRETETQYVVVAGANRSCFKNWTARNSVAGVPPGGVPVGATFILAESEYDYISPIGRFLPGNRRFGWMLSYRPRDGDNLEWVCPTGGW